MESTQYMELTQGTNIAEWLIIMNTWSGGLLATGLVISISILLFSVMKKNNIQTEQAIATASFATFCIATAMWAMTYDGMVLLQSWVVVVYLLITAIATGYMIYNNRNN